jgi:5-methylcytosine-specific restriction endonuclease McrA|nr:MAG TPA: RECOMBINATION ENDONUCLEASE VII [Caudoviricetes sp.]
MTNDELDQKWREAQARMKAMKDEEKKRRHKAIPKAVRQKVYQKYGGHCAYCGRPIDYKDMQVDHIQAHYLGGADELTNYNPACRMCNFYKSTMSIDDFREQLKKLQARLKKVYIYRLALRYRLVEEKENDVMFYFERR